MSEYIVLNIGIALVVAGVFLVVGYYRKARYGKADASEVRCVCCGRVMGKGLFYCDDCEPEEPTP